MGCIESKGVDPEKKKAKAEAKKRRMAKPKKDYKNDPLFEMFQAAGAQGDPEKAKNMYITREHIP